MTTVTLEYSNNNVVLNGILEAVAKMPDVRMVKTLVSNTEKTTTKVGTQKMSTAELYRLAEKINNSVDATVPIMTMEEIVQEIRDYRNGK
jgi:L-asparaginase/Glu-tRNA(Gln) amidotransferase subunit D